MTKQEQQEEDKISWFCFDCGLAVVIPVLKDYKKILRLRRRRDLRWALSASFIVSVTTAESRENKKINGRLDTIDKSSTASVKTQFLILLSLSKQTNETARILNYLHIIYTFFCCFSCRSR